MFILYMTINTVILSLSSDNNIDFMGTCSFYMTINIVSMSLIVDNIDFTGTQRWKSRSTGSL